MENVKYNIKKVFSLTAFIVLLIHLLPLTIGKFDIIYEIQSYLIVLFFTFLLMFFIHSSENKGIRHGLFLSSDNVIFVINRKKYLSPWAQVKIKCNLKIFNYFYFITFSSDKMKSYGFLLSPASKESFFELVNKYAPKDHEIHKIVAEYYKI